MAKQVLELVQTGSALHRSWLLRSSRNVQLSTVQFVCYGYAILLLADGSLATFVYIKQAKFRSLYYFLEFKFL